MHAEPRSRVQRRPVHGVLLLDKPLGLSSNQALQRVKWLLRAEKAGHTGTLDPLATGVLPLCFGAATKFSAQHLEADKAYEAILALGAATATGDREGEVVATAEVPSWDEAQLARAAQALQGPQWQTPPLYSALKKDGKALYAYAREGLDVPREPRLVHIYALHLAPHPSASPDGLPQLRVSVRCSKGTYVRTLGEDIARALGTVGHLTALRRTQTGPFTLQGCVELPALEALQPEQRLAWLQPPDVLLRGHVPVVLSEHDAGRFLSGMRRRLPRPDALAVRVYGPPLSAGSAPSLLGTGRIQSGVLVAERLLSPVEVAELAQQLTASPRPDLAAR